MTLIRPVTQRLPSSSQLLEESNLPLSCVVTPFADGTSLGASEGHPPPLLTSIPKCLHCGAPHPSKASFYAVNGYELVCKLCHRHSSTRFRDQEEFRMAENMDAAVYSQNASNIRAAGSENSRNNRIPTREFTLPLWNDKDRATYSSAAIACPPVWWIVVDGTCKSRAYWNAVETSLTYSLDNETKSKIPSHVHVGLLVMNAKSIGVWDLTSPVPHVLNHSTLHASQQQLDEKRDEDSFAFGLNLVPADSLHLSNIKAALRALGDCTAVSHGSHGDSSVQQHSQYQHRQNRPPLGLVLEIILDFMDNASHPGQENIPQKRGHSRLAYAGGKILCYLSGPTQEMEIAGLPTAPSTSASNYKGEIGTGGCGGSCAEYGLRFSKVQAVEEEEEVEEIDPTDMTPSNLATQLPHTNKDCHRYYQDLGTICAQAALGVDILLLVDQSPSTASKVIGLPYLRALADKSGAPGPLLFSFDSVSNRVKDEQGLNKEVLSRTPWYRPMAFGSLFRVRLSPGLTMDKSLAASADHDDHLVGGSREKSGPNLAATYGCGGLTGPGSLAAQSIENQNDQDDEMLWIMGACDDTTTVTLDLDISGIVKEEVYLDGFGDVALKPCLQICFAYTAIIQDEHGDWLTVRKIRVTSLALTVAYDVESLYASLDPEALAVALFHKLTLTSLRDGLLEAQVAGQLWLVSFLVCVYRSAKAHAARLDEQAGHGLTPENDTAFYPNERLLERNASGGALSTKDVLLAQGQERLSSVTFMLFAILQCDALRPSQGDFQPTMDSRCAASAQMFAMTPVSLSRCIAPTLELWACGESEEGPVMTHVDLSLEHLEQAVVDHQVGPTSCDMIVLLDSPRQVMVYNCQLLSGSKRPMVDLALSSGLKRSVDAACLSYRVPPSPLYVLTEYDVGSSSDKESWGDVSKARLLSDALIQDSTTVDGLDSFAQWRSEIATLVHEELLQEGI